MQRLKKKRSLPSLPDDRHLPEFERTEADLVGGSKGDRMLIDRCLAQEVAAWEELYGRFHEPICAAVRGMLGPSGRDSSLVDEFAAQVWYALVRDDGALLDRFDPTKNARLITFLRGVAHIEIKQYFRGVGRRRNHEAACPSRDDESAASYWQDVATIEDFVTTLTAGEREFLEEYLLGRPKDGGRKWSRASIWKLRSRIRAKWSAYLRGKD